MCISARLWLISCKRGAAAWRESITHQTPPALHRYCLPGLSKENPWHLWMHLLPITTYLKRMHKDAWPLNRQHHAPISHHWAVKRSAIIKGVIKHSLHPWNKIFFQNEDIAFFFTINSSLNHPPEIFPANIPQWQSKNEIEWSSGQPILGRLYCHGMRKCNFKNIW